MTFRLLVFDWDGTLMDSRARIVGSLRAAITDVGLPPRSDEALQDIIGLGLVDAMQKLFPGIGELRQEVLIAHYRKRFLGDAADPESLFEGVRETLRALAEQGYLMAVATGKSRAGLERGLRQTGLSVCFQSTRCADESHSKPHPQMLVEILRELCVEARHAVMIGDTEYDLEMARNAGTAALAVSYGAHHPERLQRHQPVACIDDIRDLPAVLAACTKAEERP